MKSSILSFKEQTVAEIVKIAPQLPQHLGHQTSRKDGCGKQIRLDGNVTEWMEFTKGIMAFRKSIDVEPLLSTQSKSLDCRTVW